MADLRVFGRRRLGRVLLFAFLVPLGGCAVVAGGAAVTGAAVGVASVGVKATGAVAKTTVKTVYRGGRAVVRAGTPDQ